MVRVEPLFARCTLRRDVPVGRLPYSQHKTKLCYWFIDNPIRMFIKSPHPQIKQIIDLETPQWDVSTLDVIPLHCAFPQQKWKWYSSWPIITDPSALWAPPLGGGIWDTSFVYYINGNFNEFDYLKLSPEVRNFSYLFLPLAAIKKFLSTLIVSTN